MPHILAIDHSLVLGLASFLKVDCLEGIHELVNARLYHDERAVELPPSFLAVAHGVKHHFHRSRHHFVLIDVRVCVDAVHHIQFVLVPEGLVDQLHSW